MSSRQAEALLDLCRRKGITLATAESCTGGLIGAMLTEIPGASDVFDRGFITYSNEAKHELLGVSTALLDHHGAVSAEVASAMAAGALARSGARLAVAVTGIAGPGGGSAEKPVGLVFLAACRRDAAPLCEERRFSGDRAEIRRQAASRALAMLHDLACKT